MGRDGVFKRHNEMVARSRAFKMSWVDGQAPGCPCKAVWALYRCSGINCWNSFSEVWISLLQTNGWFFYLWGSHLFYYYISGEGTLTSLWESICPYDKAWESLVILRSSSLSYLRSEVILSGKRKRSSNSHYLYPVRARCCRWHSVLIFYVPQNSPFTPTF